MLHQKAICCWCCCCSSNEFKFNFCYTPLHLPFFTSQFQSNFLCICPHSSTDHRNVNDAPIAPPCYWWPSSCCFSSPNFHKEYWVCWVASWRNVSSNNATIKWAKWWICWRWLMRLSVLFCMVWCPNSSAPVSSRYFCAHGHRRVKPHV